MRKYGFSEFFKTYSQGVIRKRNSIKNTLLEYYESTEEFEKCKFVVDFFCGIEDSLKKGNKRKKQSKNKQ
jgi:dGTP triphosphohydrolase